MLVKAVTLYPAGTVRRWEAIAEYVNTHSPDGSKEKTARQVVTKVKALQKLDSSEKVEGNKAAFSRFEQEHAKKGYVEADPTERYGGWLVLNPVTGLFNFRIVILYRCSQAMDS